MLQPVLIALGDRELTLAEVGAPLDLEALLPGAMPWEVEIGFGKGRYLLERAAAGAVRLLGLEFASAYYRAVRRKVQRRSLPNVLLVRGEALYLLSAVLPAAFAAAVHIYFPDPWPKARHQKRRLLEPATVDLVLGLLAPAGRLYFATDHLDYGASVAEVLRSHPAVRVEQRLKPWEGGPRTHYESRYLREGLPIVRLEAALVPGAAPLHPAGRARVLCAVTRRPAPPQQWEPPSS